MLTTRADAPSVLAALDLLPHTVRTAPRDVRTLLSGPTPDAVMVDARTELAEARSTCRMLRATGLGVPLVAVVHERTGDFAWLFVTLAALAAVIVATGLCLPRHDARALRAVAAPAE